MADRLQSLLTTGVMEDSDTVREAVRLFQQRAEAVSGAAQRRELACAESLSAFLSPSGDAARRPPAALAAAAGVALAEVLRSAWRGGNDTAALDAAIAVMRKVARHPPATGAEYAEHLCRLGNDLLSRHEQKGGGADLEAAIETLDAAVKAVEPHEAGYAGLLGALGAALQVRFEYANAPADLEAALRAGRRAAELSPPDRPDYVTNMFNLSSACHLSFLRTGLVSELDEAITAMRNAERAMPANDPDRSGALSNLSATLRVRFDQTGSPADLDAAIHAGREAVEVTPERDPYEGGYLYNLSVAVRTRFDRFGSREDLDEAIAHARAAVTVTDDDNPAVPMFLSNLSGLLLGRFYRIGAASDLDASVEAAVAAVRLTPDGHMNQASYENNLGRVLLRRYERSSAASDLEASVRSSRQAVAHTPDGDPDLPGRLFNYGNARLARHRSSHDEADLSAAIQATRQAVDRTPPGHPRRPSRLTGLGMMLRTRYAVTGAQADLESGVVMVREALAGTPPDASALAGRRLTLGRLLERLGGPKLLQEALGLYRSAAAASSATASTRLEAAMAWGALAARSGDWPSAVAGYESAIGELEVVAWAGLRQTDQVSGLQRISGLAGEAAAAALSAGRPEQALVLLEQARGVLFAQALDIRTDRSELRGLAPDLAEEMDEVRGGLDELGVEDAASEDVWEVLGGKAASERRQALTERWETLVERARGLPGLAHFLRPPPLETLLTAAEDGPVVVVNAGRLRSDALIVSRTGVHVVELPGLTHEGLRYANREYARIVTGLRRARRLSPSQRTHLDQRLRSVLEWLWEVIAQPVLDALGHRDREDRWPRLWWCPTGSLCLLPLHAAGRFDHARGTDAGVMDRVVSSYAPTLRTLIEAQRTPARTPRQARRMLVVSAPDTRPDDRLKSAELETALIGESLPEVPVTVLHGGKATRDAVDRLLPRHAWLHFIGHSAQDLQHPARARVLLSDHALTVLELMRLRPKDAELAFMSSCESGLGAAALPDEAIHLCGALHVAGYRQVIGTFWSIGDDTAPSVAATVYARLADHQMIAVSRAATVLHHVTRELRTTHPTLTWAAYHHIGI